jgi:hypothetical protein
MRLVECITTLEVLGLQSTAKAFLQATDAEASTPWLHPRSFPDRRANGVEFGMGTYSQGDTLIAATGDSVPDRLLYLSLGVHAWSSVEAAIDAQPAFRGGEVLEFILGQAAPSLLIVFKLSHRPTSSSLR